MADTFLELLHADAPREAYDDLLARLGPAAAEDHRRAVQLRERLARDRGRAAELAALYETANDLTRLRDLDRVLAAIVRRARQLLAADMTYLSLNDEVEGASYMKVTDGALTPEFGRLRLPLGTGLLGLVAQTGEPYFTDDYQSDTRFVHRDYIDDAVAGEQIRAILGVPLTVDGKVIGALLAVHRTVRPFPPGEVSLLTSFAAHAAVALENARLFDEARAAVERADEANRLLQSRTESVERAAVAHDRLTDVLVRGGGVADVAVILGELLRGQVTVYDGEGRLLAGEPTGPDPDLAPAVAEALRDGRSVVSPDGTYVAVAATGDDHLGTLVLSGVELEPAERRTLERAALVIALQLLFAQTQAEAEDRVRGELLLDLVSDRELDETLLRSRAVRQGADLDRPSALAVGRLPETDGAELHAAARAAARFAQERRGLSAIVDGAVVLAVPGADPLEVGQELARRIGGTATVGVAAGPQGRAGIATAYAAARQCVTTLLALGRTGAVSDPAGLGLARLLLGSSGVGEVAGFVRATLGPVLAYDAERGTDLRSTLEAWFATGGSQRAAAHRLHVHPNTVAQRLERVASLMGPDWREPDRALDIQVALRVLALRDK